MTPNDIEILIHCHVSPTKHPRANAPAVQGSINSMMKNGLIAGGDGIYSTTERGAAHVEQLCKLAWPEQGWVGADGNLIDR